MDSNNINPFCVRRRITSRADCEKCDRDDTIWSNMKCVTKYIMWYTDPTPTELMIAWTSVGWGICLILLGDDKSVDTKSFGVLSSIANDRWGAYFTSLGVLHFVMAFFPVTLNNKVKFTRIILNFTTAAIWTYASFMLLGWPLSPFFVPCSITAAAGWWTFVRSGDPYHKG